MEVVVFYLVLIVSLLKVDKDYREDEGGVCV